MQTEEPYVAPFVRRLMPDATEDEILEASENLRAYLTLLYRIFLRQEMQGAADSQPREGHDRVADEGGGIPEL